MAKKVVSGESLRNHPHWGLPVVQPASIEPVHFRTPKKLSEVHVPEVGAQLRRCSYGVVGVHRDNPNLCTAALGWRNTRKQIIKLFVEICEENKPSPTGFEIRIWDTATGDTYRTVPAVWMEGLA